jgi:general stress protein CsbA
MYKFGTTVFNLTDVPFTDIAGSVGFGFRAAASFMALIVTILYLVKRGLSTCEVVTSFRWIILLEAAYWALFLPAGIWGFNFQSVLYSREFFILEAGLPCLVEALVMPTVLVVLFFKISPNKPAQGAINWGLIAAAAHLFVFWFNYTSQWWSEIFLQGTALITNSHVYTVEFALTVVGLLLITAYAAVYAKNSSKAKTLGELNLRKAGLILTGLGLYFDALLLLWFLFGDMGGLTVWPTFAVLHNVDLWMATLPLIGVPLIFSKKRGD